MSSDSVNPHSPAGIRSNEAGDDARIVLAVRRGDNNAFGTLVRRYQKRVYNLSLMMLRSPERAEDISQEAFVRAYQKLSLFDIKRSFYPWLATITVRLAQSELRKKQVELQQEDAGSIPTESPNPLEILLENETQAIWKLVAKLSSGERTAVFLVYRQELTVLEAATAVGVTPGTIKTLLFRARKNLRSMLELQQETSP